MKILSITPISHINGLVEKLKSIGDLRTIPDPSINELLSVVKDYDIVFTNPNKSKIFLDENILKYASNLKIICTASTGTNHIDIDYAISNNIKIISLTEELDVLKTITSTAEHAFALTLSSIRNIIASNNHVRSGNWDYEPFIGRQMNKLNVGVIGCGRLGSMYVDFCKAFGSKILVFDPYKKINDKSISQVSSLVDLLKNSDIISLHVHIREETKHLINFKTLKYLKSSVLIVNTSRGEIINENDMVEFLRENPDSKIATDVIYDEIRNRENSPLLKYSKISNQVLITPHVGGMTIEAQSIAYNHVAKILEKYVNEVIK